jgi:hypothetical protein
MGFGLREDMKKDRIMSGQDFCVSLRLLRQNLFPFEASWLADSWFRDVRFLDHEGHQGHEEEGGGVR